MSALVDSAGQARILEAIRAAEKNTSGEIRVHLQRRVKGEIFEAAKKRFEQMGLTATKARNGVLVFVALDDHAFTILGDRGINEKVGADFWASSVELMTEFFKRGDLAGGIEAGVLHVGKVLKELFPRQADDVNELTDEISTKE